MMIQLMLLIVYLFFAPWMTLLLSRSWSLHPLVHLRHPVCSGGWEASDRSIVLGGFSSSCLCKSKNATPVGNHSGNNPWVVGAIQMSRFLTEDIVSSTKNSSSGVTLWKSFISFHFKTCPSDPSATLCYLRVSFARCFSTFFHGR